MSTTWLNQTQTDTEFIIPAGKASFCFDNMDSKSFQKCPKA